MQLLLVMFFISLLVGQIGAVAIAPGVNIYAHDVVLCLLFVVAGFTLIGKKKLVRPRLAIPLLSFFCVAIVSLVLNIFGFEPYKLAQASLYLFRWVAYALLYIALSQGFVSSGFLFGGLYWFGTGVTILGFIQYALYPNLRFLMYMGWDPHYYRLFSTFFDPNFAGIIIVLTFFLGMYLWKQKKNTLFLLGSVVNLFGLYLTYSRSSYLAFVAGLLVYIFFQKKWKILIVLAAFICLVIIIPKPGGKTLLLTRVDSTVARVGNWQESFRIIAQSPIIGRGFNTLRFVPRSDVEPPAKGVVSRSDAGLDSSILFLLATTGLVGAIAYGWIFWRIVDFYRKPRRLFEMRGIWLSVLAALLVHSLFVNSLFYPWVMIWLWVFAAAGELTSHT